MKTDFVKSVFVALTVVQLLAVSSLPAYTAAPAACPDLYEPNDTFAQAMLLDPGTIDSYICATVDLDYFRFLVDAGGRIRAELSQLPANYNLCLYGPDQKEVACSKNAGTEAEIIDEVATLDGWHYLLVSGAKDAYDPKQPYRLWVKYPLADLVINDLWQEGGQICYQVQNIGGRAVTNWHSTSLEIDGLAVGAGDLIDRNLGPGERLNRCFQYDWTCTPKQDEVTACADQGNYVDESDEDNNCRSESWLCDTTPPTITAGPLVSNLTRTSATVSWTTDERADSRVQLGRYAGLFADEEVDTTRSKEHMVVLSDLQPGTSYHYQVLSADASGNSVASSDLFFQTQPPSDNTEPDLSFFAATGDGLPLEFTAEASDDVGVERVEFTFDNQLFEIDYSAPFQSMLDPIELEMDPEGIYAPHEMGATAFDLHDNTYSLQYTVAGGEWLGDECAVFGASLDFRLPSPGFAMTTTGTTVPPGEVVIEVDSRQSNTLITDEDRYGWLPGATGPRGEEWTVMKPVEFFMDGTPLFTTSQETDFYIDTVIRYTFDPAGLEVGWHELSARTQTNQGCIVRDSVDIVVHGPPDLAIDRTVVLRDTYLEVELTVTNVGTGPAYLDRLRDTVVGLQVTAATSDMGGSRPAYSYLTGVRQSAVEWTFVGFVDALAPGDSATFGYRAVPILYQGDVTYQIGGSGNIAYHDLDDDFTEDITLTSAWVEVPGEDAPLPLDEAIDEAVGDANYLLVTNPFNLFALNNRDEVNTLLQMLAKLASLPERTGVLAYFNGYHVLSTSFHAGDLLAAGESLLGASWNDEIVIADSGDNLIRVYHSTGEHTLPGGALPFVRFITENDAVAVGNFHHTDINGDAHNRAEIVVADDWDGQATIYQYNYIPDLGTFSNFSLDVDYGPADALGVGNVHSGAWGNDPDEIVVANRNGWVYFYDDLSGTEEGSFLSSYQEGDGFAVGDVTGPDLNEEVVVADVSDDTILIYDQPFPIITTRAEYSIRSVELAEEDGLAVGDLCGDGTEEIILADESEDRIYVYGYDASDDRFEAISDFGYPFQAGDGLAVGDLLPHGKDEILVARGTSSGLRSEGDVEVLVFLPGEPPGDRYALDDLINLHGLWTEKLDDSWVDYGHLLLVGETEIIPAFSTSWDLPYTDYGRVDYTDREYASVDGDVNYPDLATGRMIGYWAEQLIQSTGTSLDIVQGRESFDNSDAYCVSGSRRGASGDGDPIDFAELRNSVALEIASRDFSVLREHCPSDADFFSHAEDKDVILLSGHGGADHWDTIDKDDVAAGFDPGEARPLIYAASCLTGRYAGGRNFAEMFLDAGASAYVGATEVSFVPQGDRLAEEFFANLDSFHTLGSALRHAKCHLQGVVERRRDPEFNAYVGAIHHLYGDPKLELTWFFDAAAGAQSPEPPPVDASSVEVSFLTEALASFSVSVPDYEVTSLADGDRVEIPGGGMLMVPGQPMVPTFDASASFPKGTQIKEVILSHREGMTTATGLDIPPVVLAIPGLSPVEGTAEGEDWWPEGDFAWTTRRGPDDTLLLQITLFPFYYNPATTNVRFYQDYTFKVRTAASEVEIPAFYLDRHTYMPGQTVHAEVFLRLPEDPPQDLVVDAALHSEAQDIVAGLPLRTLHDARGLVSFALDWDSSGVEGGTYRLELWIRDTEGTPLAHDLRDFRLGVTEGQITRLDAAPHAFDSGDPIDLTMVFENVGTEVISGTAVLRVHDEAGATLQESTFEVSNLQSGKKMRFDDVWDTTGVEDGRYTVVGYVSYGGTLAGPKSALVETWHRTYLPFVARKR